MAWRTRSAHRAGALLGLAAALTLPLLGIARTFAAGLRAASDDAQWQIVSEHEQRFVQALRMGTSSEADDASC